MPRTSLLAACLVITAVLVAGCDSNSNSSSGTAASTNCQPRKPIALQFAHNVTISDRTGYRVITVKHPTPGGREQSIVVLDCGTTPKPSLPSELSKAPVVASPVRSLWSQTTTALPYLPMLGATDVLTGVSNPKLVTGPQLRERIDRGGVSTFSANGTLSAEQVIAAHPDVLVGQGTEDPALPTITQAGIPVVQWADYLESSPLGQAEWIKVMGALTGRDEQAAAEFNTVVRQYNAVAEKVKNAANVAATIGQPYQGQWSVPTGQSTTGQLLKAARITWSGVNESGPGTTPRDLEFVLARDGGAKLWLADGPFATTAAIRASDSRLAKFAAMAAGGSVWTRDRGTTPAGGNAAFERGIAHPDELLTDIVAIAHPELFAQHRFTYYQKVPE